MIMLSSKNRIFIFLLSFFLSGLLVTNAGADIFTSDRNGPYLGVDLGIAFQRDLELNGSDNDVATRCDQILRRLQDDDALFVDITAASLADDGPTGCQRGDTWSTDGDLGAGIIAGGQAGYIFGNFRVEAEYIYRDHNSDKRPQDANIDDKAAELVDSSVSMTNFSSHSVFANFYYDFLNESAVTPYLGAGAGWSNISLIYDASFARNPNSATLIELDVPGVAAGATTRTEDKLTDNVFGWQVIAGTDYEIDKNWSIGLKLRYSRFGKVEDSDRWDHLRSHESAIADDTADSDASSINDDAQSVTEINAQAGVDNFDPAVVYRVKTSNPEVWSAALNLKYKFGGSFLR